MLIISPQLRSEPSLVLFLHCDVVSLLFADDSAPLGIGECRVLVTLHNSPLSKLVVSSFLLLPSCFLVMSAAKEVPSATGDSKSLDLLIAIMKDRTLEQVLTWSEQVARVAVNQVHRPRTSSCD